MYEVRRDVDQGDVVPLDVERRHAGAVVVPEQVAAAVPEEFAGEVGEGGAAGGGAQVDLDQRPGPRLEPFQQQLDRVLRGQLQLAAVGGGSGAIGGHRRPRHVEHLHPQVIAQGGELPRVAQLVTCCNTPRIVT